MLKVVQAGAPLRSSPEGVKVRLERNPAQARSRLKLCRSGRAMMPDTASISDGATVRGKSMIRRCTALRIGTTRLK